MKKKPLLTGPDMFLLSLLVLLGVILTIGIYSPFAADSHDGESLLEVRLDGRVQMRLPLRQDTEKTIAVTETAASTFQIKDGAVRMVRSDCPDRICVKTGTIRSAGETIICLPHRLVLAIVEPDGGNGQPDAVVR